MLVTLTLFAATSAALAFLWNRWFTPVPIRVALLLWIVCAVYEGGTLVTTRVDMPAGLAFNAYPWRATGIMPVRANTGILFAQIAPWSRIARDAIMAGELPFWNRYSASGAPLLANQQTAIFHPFTLLGLLLSLGKAFTLTASLRLFFVAFFSFVLLRNFEISNGASVFGSVAYTFCSFHVIWLLFPLGLSTMMLPLCLVGVQEFLREPRGRTYAILLMGLTLTVLGGHPESALWVWIATILVALFLCLTTRFSFSARVLRLVILASAFLIAMLLTAFFWFPTLRALRETPRYQAMQSRAANPADHGLSAEWLLPLIAPNVLGAPANGTYTPPRGFHPAILNDYGEVASSYAGLITLGLALASPLIVRRRPLLLAIALMALSVLTFAEVPFWRDLVRAIPLAGISIHQRLRIFWDLGACIAAALAIDAAMKEERVGPVRSALVVVLIAFSAIYMVRRPDFLNDPLGFVQTITPIATVLAMLLALRWRGLVVVAATLLVFADLVVATYHYNPSSEPVSLYPVTGAIATLQHAQIPFRFAAWGWSFLPDTPGYYGIEDIKTTDPIQSARYMRLMTGYMHVDPGSYDQVLQDASQPFFDFLNIKYVYVPPDQTLTDPRFVEIYRGPDGSILQNTRALPRYFFVQQVHVDPSFDRNVRDLRKIRDFGREAIVDHVPATVLSAAPFVGRADHSMTGGTVTVRRYSGNDTALDLTSNGWNLLVSSDVLWPGWRAYWNGKRLSTVIVNGAFLGCFVPPGTGQLIFRYAPDEFTHGVRAAGAGIALLLMAGAVLHFKNKAPLRR